MGKENLEDYWDHYPLTCQYWAGIPVSLKDLEWLFVLEQYAEFGLLFVLQWEYFLQLLEKYSSFSISIILLL